MRSTTTLLVTTGAILALAAPGLSPATAGGHHHGSTHADLRVVAELDGPRGVDALGHGRTLVTETGGAFSLVVERRHRPARVIELGVLQSEFPPAIALGRHGWVFLLTGASGPPPEEGRSAASTLTADEPAPAFGATLYRWRHGWEEPRPFVDIAEYQTTDPDPADLEDLPGDSNPFGLAALRDGSVLVADAAGNDLLRVDASGAVTTVARLLPRVVEVPEGLPELPPEQGGPLPPAGTPVPSEAVATSVTVGPDGAWYVGELRGFPATPGTSQVWRIEPGTVGATCDPEAPDAGPCTRYADGLTSIVDLAAGRRGIYALELSKQSWFATELGLPGSETGGLFLITGHGHHTRLKELATDQLVSPGGIDVAGAVYVTGPLFGPGTLSKLH